MPDIECRLLLRIGQVWEKIDALGWHWSEELGNLVIITAVSDTGVVYRYLPESSCHATTSRTFSKFEGRFKLVIDI